jgi:hypothetical protein
MGAFGEVIIFRGTFDFSSRVRYLKRVNFELPSSARVARVLAGFAT